MNALLPAGVTYDHDDGDGAYDPVTGVWTIGDIDPTVTEKLKVYATVDAGLSEADGINIGAITYTYIIYLVKQGVRLSELKTIIGNVEPKALSQYSRFSPNKKGVAMAEINLLYPALEKYLD